MNQKLKIIIGLVAVFAVLAVVATNLPSKEDGEEAVVKTAGPAGGKSVQSTESPTGSQSGVEGKKPAPSAAQSASENKDIDTIANAIAADAENDSAVAAENDADIQYMNESNSLVNSEGMYNANEF